MDERKRFKTMEEFVMNEFYELEDKYEDLLGRFDEQSDELAEYRAMGEPVKIDPNKVVEIDKVAVMYTASKLSDYTLKGNILKILGIDTKVEDWKTQVASYLEDAFTDKSKMKKILESSDIYHSMEIRATAIHRVIKIAGYTHCVQFYNGCKDSSIYRMDDKNYSFDRDIMLRELINRQIKELHDVFTEHLDYKKEDIPKLEIEFDNEVLPSGALWRETDGNE